MGCLFSKPRRAIVPLVAVPLSPKKISEFFTARDLLCAPDAKPRYYAVAGKVFAIINHLSQIPNADLIAAVQAFNQSFHELEINDDAAGVAAAPEACAKHNLLHLINQVSAAMNAGASHYKLVYHNKYHGYEVAADSALCDTPLEDQDFKLLKFICGLYHDVQFSHQRIIDEEASVQACVTDLRLVLDAVLDQQQVKIIKDLIEVIILAGTIPCMLQKDKNGNPFPTMPSLFEVLNELAPKLDERCPLIARLCRSIARMDVQRTSSPKVYKEQFFYSGDCWQILQPFYAEFSLETQFSLQRKLTQNLRTLCEFSLKDNARNSIAQYVFDLQYQLTCSEPVFSEAKIIVFAKQLAGEGNAFSEASFAQRMDNTCKLYPGSNSDDFVNTWQEHIQFLKKISTYLQDAQNPLEQRAALVMALVQAAKYQDGLVLSPQDLTHFADEMAPRISVRPR